MTNESKERALDMFKMRLDGATYQAIANKYGVTKQCVHQILGGITTPKKSNCDSVIYKGLRDWMKENNISAIHLHRLLNPSTTSSNAVITRDRLKGKRQFKLSEIILIIKESGMTFEQLFMQD